MQWKSAMQAVLHMRQLNDGGREVLSLVPEEETVKSDDQEERSRFEAKEHEGKVKREELCQRRRRRTAGFFASFFFSPPLGFSSWFLLLVSFLSACLQLVFSSIEERDAKRNPCHISMFLFLGSR